jgi:hypothetical protein
MRSMLCSTSGGETMRLSEQFKGEVSEEYKAHHFELEPGTMALRFVGRGQPLTVKVEDAVTLGRHVPGEPPPTVDLTEYHGGLLGVSRRHAVIYPSHHSYIIKDLGSTNGTWVNENRLIPHQPYDLRNRDQVRLGELILFVFYALAHSCQDAQLGSQ